MFGRKATLPIDFNVEKDYDPDKKIEKHLASHEPSKEAVAMHRKNIEKAVKIIH